LSKKSGVMVSFPSQPDRAEHIGLLDIGTSKTVCMIASCNALSRRILGMGLSRTRGMKASVVMDPEQLEASVRLAIQQAERAASMQLDRVFVAIGCGRLKSVDATARAELEDLTVSRADIARVIEGGRAYAERNGRMLVHLSRLGFHLDTASGLEDPIGLPGRRLAVDLSAVIADETPVRNLIEVVERIQLDIVGLAPAPLASVIAVTTSEERRDGIIVIDLGGGSTSIALCAGGHVVAVDALPVGGDHITFDLARALRTPPIEAERIKTNYGSVAFAHSDERDAVTYRVVGDVDADHHQATRAELRNIIMPRVDTLLRHLAERIEASAFARHGQKRIVLTGGASQLNGLGAYVASRLGRPVRIGRPLPMTGILDGVFTPAFATVSGLLDIARDSSLGVRAVDGRGSIRAGWFGRTGHGLKLKRNV
jgi:cell division protein FtsA